MSESERRERDQGVREAPERSTSQAAPNSRRTQAPRITDEEISGQFASLDVLRRMPGVTGTMGILIGFVTCADERTWVASGVLWGTP